jgi:ribonuclease HII
MTPGVPNACFQDLLAFDGAYQQVIGVDEAGRGSLIGPVVAAAVCLTPIATADPVLWALNDSKKLRKTQRTVLAGLLQRLCPVGVGWASREEVDLLNVHRASLLAAKRAVWALGVEGFVLMDGKFPVPGLPGTAVVGGDGLSASIAAASVIAKVTRDAYVTQLAEHFPCYGWEHNMGYGTPAHRNAMAQQGLTPFHRKSFMLKT